jgi:hypothetical protein
MTAAAESLDTPGNYFNADRGFGTDVYAGPFDALLNKGFAVAQWEDRNRAIFRHDYGWAEVSASLTRPGAVVARRGGWGEVLKVHALPFYKGGYREPQWISNYFGHVFEGGLVHRRLIEWNRARGVPFPVVTAAAVTYASSIVNEAYETPPRTDGVPAGGNPGIVTDLLIFDPLGILLFSFDGVARLAHRTGVELWPSQGSLVLNDGTIHNNGESFVFKVPLPFTDHRLFLRGGIGIEAGLSLGLRDALDLSIAVGQQSFARRIIAETELEEADFDWSGSVWLDRDGALLAGATFDRRTDRRVALNVYPGWIRPGGLNLGGWLLVDSNGRPYIGITGNTLGLGAGIRF